MPGEGRGGSSESSGRKKQERGALQRGKNTKKERLKATQEGMNSTNGHLKGASCSFGGLPKKQKDGSQGAGGPNNGDNSRDKKRNLFRLTSGEQPSHFRRLLGGAGFPRCACLILYKYHLPGTRRGTGFFETGLCS